MKMQRSIRSEPNFLMDEGIRKQRNLLDFAMSVLAIHNRRVEGSRSEAAGIMLEFITNAEITRERKGEPGRRFKPAYMFHQRFFLLENNQPCDEDGV
ncbi:hypothetical protein G6M50_21535 [Agrobacterium rhizogenes]|nr:hypothetical protein [Rhizobium rhizogenes]NTJ80375.1 hypothetical protein [Rhizobium rhizogenes]